VVIVGAAPATGLTKYRQPVSYLVVGAWNTLFGYGVFVLLYHLLKDTLPADAVLVISYAFSVANAFIGYRYMVFRSSGSMKRELPRFATVYGLTLAANLLVLPLALHALPWNAYVVQALFTVVIVAASYFGHKHFSFRQEPGRD
jgi:putative flippase GtrA